MINKQGLIFLTLTSLILVLSVYYVTMPNELLLTNNGNYLDNNEQEVSKEEKVVITNTNTVSAMKSLLQDERHKLMTELNTKLIDKNLSAEEKNNIYEEIKVINKIETMESEIEKKKKKDYNDMYISVSFKA